MQNDNNSPQEAEMSPFIPSTSIKYDVISPSSTNTTILISTESISRFKQKVDTSDDEISVGCPSPVNMSPKEPQEVCNNIRNKEDKILLSTVKSSLPDTKIGVKSFSIMEILNHRPRPVSSTANSSTITKIVRPWDNCENDLQNQLKADTSSWSLAEQITFLRRAEIAAAHAFSSSYTSETGSDRSSSVTSECCSPDNNNSIHYQQSQKQRLQNRNKGSLESTPLDALFQMTSKTFDSNSLEVNSDGQNMNLFNNRQQPKKKRKSRTAFTNHQIFELEKRFLYQKYLSPADRDEIAASLGLSNAQVITWFQNRRAKLKRDMEELKKDVESAKILTAHKTFLENVQDLNTLKKKALLSVNDCPKV